MNWIALFLGMSLIISGAVYSGMEQSEVAYDTQLIIGMVMFLSGLLCVAISGIRR